MEKEYNWEVKIFGLAFSLQKEKKKSQMKNDPSLRDYADGISDVPMLIRIESKWRERRANGHQRNWRAENWLAQSRFSRAEKLTRLWRRL